MPARAEATTMTYIVCVCDTDIFLEGIPYGKSKQQ